jgi:putative aminophosphonate oxidoreductase
MTTTSSNARRSWWLQQALDDEPPLPPLRGPHRADIAIAGGGYVGLWTAIRIKEREPDCDVVVLERDICGGGASGRNGGFVLTWWPKLASLTALCGEEEAIRLCRASEDAIDEIEQVCRDHDIDPHFVRRGWIWAATSPAHVGSWDGVVQQCEALGLDVFQRLTLEEVAQRTGSPAHMAGVLEPRAATVQPAILARGLRKIAVEKGVRIYEQTPVLDFSRRRPVAIRTPLGLLAADRLVIAMNAWAAGIRELQRTIFGLSSEIVLTAPRPDLLEETGWTGGESIADCQMMVDYYRTTRDGRIAFGKGAGVVALGGRLGERFEQNPQRRAEILSDFHRYYPAFRDVVITDEWSGPIDRSVNGLPTFGWIGGRQNIVYGVGWSGNGVGPSVVGGKILASLALETSNEWSESGLVTRNPGLLPPEPVRFAGAQVVREAVRRKDLAEARGEEPRRAIAWLASLAPAGLEDKSA